MDASDPHQALRNTILTESLETSNTSKWGYFGFSGPLCIGDNSYAPRLMKQAKTEEESEPLRNICAKPMLKGSSPDVYFKFEAPLSDPYVDPGTAMKKGKIQMLDPENSFRPPGKVKTGINKLGYHYEPHMDTAKDPHEVKAKYQDVMPARQIYANPLKKGGAGVMTSGVLFGWDDDPNPPRYVEDDYDNARKLRRAEFEEHHAKMQEQAFYGNFYGNKSFHPDSEVYHYEEPTNVPRDPKPDTMKVVQHENPMRPCGNMKKGFQHALIGGIPEYIEEGETGGPKRKPKTDEPEMQPFKTNNPSGIKRPTPSIVCNIRNMRNERPSSFIRPSL